MYEYLKTYIGETNLREFARDALDIAIAYYIFYRLLLVARGTRAMQVAAGLVVVALLYVGAQALGLQTIVTLVGALLQSFILVIVVVFQNDIRRALQRVGSRAIFGGWGRAHQSEVIEQVVEASRELARHRIGALITFEQDANLDEFVGQNKGIDVDSAVSSELLVSLFLPEGLNKLHDGAVIIRNLRIAKAGVFFPMPENRSFDSSFGSRHRAALGITEETDAVVVVVSEERGTLSFCFNGNMATDLQADQLREMLDSVMNPRGRKKATNQAIPTTQRNTPIDAAITQREPKTTTLAQEAPPGSERMPRERLTTNPLAAEKLLESAPAPLRKSRLPQPEESTRHPLQPESVREPAPLRKSRIPENTEKQEELQEAPPPRPMPKAEVEIVHSPEDDIHVSKGNVD
ncbi:MAG: diadenylate cyclase CdaA [Polyangiaceae bacterium]|nr:diadenylate cyclase CdaA [Polyangiaceae bacterium]